MANLFKFNPDLEAVLKIGTDAKPEKPYPEWADVKAAFAALEAGNAEFVRQLKTGEPRPAINDLNEARLRDIANDHLEPETIPADSPYAAVLCCSDHRASPELIFWQGLGRLFVIREAGNLLDHNSAASLEYAVRVLKVPLIVVLGHIGCGAVEGALSTFQKGTATFGAYVPALFERFRDLWTGRPGGTDTDEDWLGLESMKRTKTMIEQIPLVTARLGNPPEKGNLAVVTARYDIATGVVTWIDRRALPHSVPTT